MTIQERIKIKAYIRDRTRLPTEAEIASLFKKISKHKSTSKIFRPKRVKKMFKLGHFAY